MHNKNTTNDVGEAFALLSETLTEEGRFDYLVGRMLPTIPGNAGRNGR
jgi:hypothetical protein